MKENIGKIRRLLAAHYPAGEIDAFIRIIFEKLMRYSAVDLAMHASDTLPEPVARKIDDITARLIEREPIQYILDDAYFYGLHFHVSRGTFIPRPETERLVDMVAGENTASDLQVLDIGTGCGCIAIALARTLKFPMVTATDISATALEVARRNALELKAHVGFKQADILATPTPSNPTYDIIVSNPPYIAISEREAMDRNVLDYEPHEALFVGDDNPLLFYKAIAAYAIAALKKGGRLYLEINPRFASDVERLLDATGFTAIDTERDYTGKLRFTTATRKKNDYT